MKILQVIPYFHPKRGGDVNVCYNLSKQLVKKGHNITILTTNFEADKEYIKSIEKEKVGIIALSCIANIGLFLYSPSIKRWAEKHLKKYDIAHMHTYRAYQNNVISHYARKYNIPYIIQAHGSLLTFFAKPKLKKLYDFIWGYKLLRDAHTVIALTETEKEQYKKMGVKEDKIEIVPNGIDLEEYENLPKRGEFRKKCGIKEDEKIVLYLGRLHGSKGIDLLIDIFGDIAKELDRVKLVIVGPDDGFLLSLRRQVERLQIIDKVLFTGFITQKEKISALVDADLFVTPKFSGFPMSFLEACACGTPIITTNAGDELGWIHNRAGYVAEYDKDSLKDIIFKVLENKGLRDNMGNEGKKLVRKEFNWDIIARKIEDIYSRILGR